MKKFTSVGVLSILMACFITAILIYLPSNRKYIYEGSLILPGNRVDMPTLTENKTEETLPLLTIFTTVKEKDDIPHHQLAFNIVMTNWPSFDSYIRPVVFLNFTNSSLADTARRSGWDVLQLEGTNNAGTPYLMDMYRAVFNRYKSMLYGFANADILFNDGIVKTLLEVKKRLEGLKSNVLVMGRRTNVDVDLNKTASFEEFDKPRLRDTADRRGKLFPEYAIDYFFLTNEGCSLKWSQLVNVVIGRPAYDNYLVAMAIRHGVNVIEATKTVLAVHVSEPGQNFHGSLNKDAKYNKDVIGRFSYNDGLTSAAKLNTMEDFMGNVVIVRR